MSRDEGDLGSPRDEDMDIGIQTSDKLDLNLDQDCQSPNVAQVSGNQYSLCSKDDSVTGGILKIGTEFESDEHAYTFYNKYARLVGFSVRKDWVNRSKVHGLVVSRKFTCSKEGYRRKDKRDANVKKHRKETRTGCLAHMIITRQPDGKYQVTHFEAKHNHDVKPNNAQTFQLQEELCVSQASKDDFSSNLGMGSNSTLELMNKRIEVGESLDYLAMNFKNYLQSERTRDMKKGDAGRLLHYFQRQHFENPAFFHAIQVDIDDKISNIFWADDKMVADYEHFGDVVCLDTTYRISKDIQPFVQFVGLNHHNLAITFAAALLFDDTVESLKWLFTTFIEAMSGKKPKVILIDQDAGIVEAINSVLPETSHHICVWQMYQNALKHLNHALKDIESFSSDFRSCIYDHNDEEDFIHAWEALLEKYDLQQNEWLRWMFREKEKWAVVYGRNTFFVDAKGSHVVEDLYNNFRGHLNSDQDALQFFKVFERMVDEQRFKEIQANDEMIRCMPRLIGNVVLLKHASDIYTPKAFEIFQREYEKSLNFVVSQYSESEIFLEYKVNTFGRSREYTVTFNPSDDTVICSCMKFENVGILCGHALKVLDNRNIKVVPSQYILKRWTKDARTGRVGETKEFIAQENSKLVAASRYKELCHRILAISARAIESEDAFQFASRQLDDVIEGVEKILAFKTEGVQGMSSSSTAANVSESENPEIFLDERTMEDQDKDNRVARISEKENAAPDRQQQKNIIEKCSRKKGLTSAPPPPYTINFVSSPPQPCVSTEAQTHNSVLQGLYQEVQSMYQQQNSVMNHQDNPNPYQQSNFYSDQHDSPRQTPLLQAMDLDLQHPQPSSFL
ncbi:protein FAR1-RELATED SEQUENCE 5 isoform X2 [Jatropha curcas]|uniref:protein FAR1-RELATED SEQUENCE 5 isoform X2 n=1 Tax=Jatropha curcas TaxID=180498 RepID=UPI0005FBA495|nr:protein FAR1-RELATED SEQUENCE 5 isoform X2 [Jatropha curcas]